MGEVKINVRNGATIWNSDNENDYRCLIEGGETTGRPIQGGYMILRKDGWFKVRDEDVEVIGQLEKKAGYVGKNRQLRQENSRYS